MSAVELTIIGKPDCHLCDAAESVIDAVVSDLELDASVTIVKRSILDDPDLHERYWEKIPVVLVNGAEHAHWHVDADKLRTAILEG